MSEETKRIFDVIFSSLQLLGVLVAAVWAYVRFFREGTHRPRIEFDVQGVFFGMRDGCRGATFVTQILNKGNVEHKFTRISLKLRGIKADQPFKRRNDGRWDFPESLIEAELVPEKFGYFFVRPGVTQPVTFSTTIDAGVTHILARASFKYEGSDDLHTAERVFEISGNS